MMTAAQDDVAPSAPEGPAADAPPRVLPPAALRALAEAAERRRLEEIRALTGEAGGPEGPEPTRYGDWERKGLAVDF
jgi:hypothetical protein